MKREDNFYVPFVENPCIYPPSCDECGKFLELEDAFIPNLNLTYVFGMPKIRTFCNKKCFMETDPCYLCDDPGVFVPYLDKNICSECFETDPCYLCHNRGKWIPHLSKNVCRRCLSKLPS